MSVSDAPAPPSAPEKPARGGGRCLGQHLLERPGLSELEAFALGFQKAFPAFQAACSLPYRTGRAAGCVNTLKHIKGSLYGRGSFELLRQRVLQSAA